MILEPATRENKRAVLLRAAEIVESGWTQHVSARAADGYPCDPNGSGYPVAFCMVGAFYRARCKMRVEAWPLPNINGVTPSAWNDRPGRTKEEVAAKLREFAEAT